MGRRDVCILIRFVGIMSSYTAFSREREFCHHITNLMRFWDNFFTVFPSILLLLQREFLRSSLYAL